MRETTVAKSLASADAPRTFIDGSVRRSVSLRSVSIGYGVDLPGWKWSLHAGGQTGRHSEKHIGVIVSGKMTIRDANGIDFTLGAGDAFEVGPRHDAWVEGEEPCVAIDFSHGT